MVALGGIARTDVIDLVGSDLAERNQGRDTQGRRRDEYGAVREVGSERAHERGGQSISGTGEAIISPDARRHSMTAREPETNCSDRGPDEACGHAMENLGCEHKREARAQRENERRGRDQDKAGRRQSTLPTHRVGERAARNLHRHSRQSTDGQGEPDILFRPAEIG